jgi:superfamily II DNA or RNA helicase
MKTLFPAQQKARDFFVSVHLNRGLNTLDTSMVGTGKTVVSASLAIALGFPVAVVCPKSVIVSWKRELLEHGIEPIFVLNYESLRTGNTVYLKKAGKKIMRWALPPDTLIIFDEVHKCKGAYSQNAQLLISAAQQKYRLHLLSATACEDPTEMRALGYAIGLHNLNTPQAPLRGWVGWMYSVGCGQDTWGSWYLRDKEKLKDLKEQLYGPNGIAYRLSVKDFPDSFKQNHVHMFPVSCTKDVYSRYKISEEALTSYIIDSTIDEDQEQESEPFIVRLLRARQEAELNKVTNLVQLTQDYVDQNMAVILFVNFRETAEKLAQELKCNVVQGGQLSTKRQEFIDNFQNDTDQILVINIEAGGTGLSLHDVSGKRQRVSLISPTFNAKSHLQVLGRTHRNGAKSDSLQLVVVAAGTVEENVVNIINKKCENLQALHGIEYTLLDEGLSLG